jgi:hypothetical protein
MKRGEIIDVTLDGEVRSGPRRASWVDAALRLAVLVAVLAAVLAVAALALWLALILIPVAFGAALVAWGLWRWRMWRRKGRAVARVPGDFS